MDGGRPELTLARKLATIRIRCRAKVCLTRLVFDMRRITLAKALSLATLSVLCGNAFAGLLDGTILISRAANNKTVTVTYEGLKANLVELRINGESVSSRVVGGEKTEGNTKFAINPATLKDGENAVEVRIYDAEGKLVGNERSTLTVNREADGPVFLKGPKTGSTIVGPVQIELGLKESLRDIYVSFFVDDEFKSIRNFPPYTFVWDTSRVTNGWHEVQAWVVDAANETYKTEKVRLYVNNPSGRTERMQPILAPNKATESDPAAATTTSGTIGIRSTRAQTQQTELVTSPSAPKTNNVTRSSKVNEPSLTVLPEEVKATPTTTVGESSSLASKSKTRTPEVEKGEMTGQRLLLPTGNREILPIVSVKTHNAEQPGEPSKLPLREVSIGSRITDVRTFDVFLNGSVLNFDVAPRVLEGVPFAPFRHLFEGAGGTVKWLHEDKVVEAEGMGNQVKFKIGALSGTNNGSLFQFERAPFLESGRTVVPLSFVNSTLDIKVQYDPNTGHVLLTNSKGK